MSSKSKERTERLEQLREMAKLAREIGLPVDYIDDPYLGLDGLSELVLASVGQTEGLSL